MREPQEIQDEEYEQVVGRVAAVDVAKASGMVCTRVPHPSRPGRRLTKVWEVDATSNAITELADHLVRHGIEKVTVESTSDCCPPFLYLLAAAGEAAGGRPDQGVECGEHAGHAVSPRHAGGADRR